MLSRAFRLARALIASALIGALLLLVVPSSYIQKIPAASELGLIATQNKIHTEVTQLFYAAREASKRFITGGIEGLFNGAETRLQEEIQKEFDQREDALKDKVNEL